MLLQSDSIIDLSFEFSETLQTAGLKVMSKHVNINNSCRMCYCTLKAIPVPCQFCFQLYLCHELFSRLFRPFSHSKKVFWYARGLSSTTIFHLKLTFYFISTISDFKMKIIALAAALRSISFYCCCSWYFQYPSLLLLLFCWCHNS